VAVAHTARAADDNITSERVEGCGKSLGDIVCRRIEGRGRERRMILDEARNTRITEVDVGMF
jgi:hypothetical protein